jgi:hypothetical protein
MTEEAIHLSNNPPLVDPEQIAQRHKAAFVAASEVLKLAADWPAEVNGPADLEVLTAGVRSIMGAAKTLDGCRTLEKRRFDDAGKEVQGLFLPRLTKLEAAKQAALGAITRHNRKIEEEQRRLAAEAAQRERVEMERRQAAAAALEAQGHADVAETVMDTAVEAERMAERLDRQATGSAADLVRTHTAGGTVTSATSMAFEIEDGAALRSSLGTLGDYIDQPSIDKAIRAYMKAMKLAGRDLAVPGVRFFADSKARVR